MYFTYNGGADWTQFYKLTASDGSLADNFGTAVSLEEFTLVVGSPKYDFGQEIDNG